MTTNISNIKKILFKIRYTALHPQWLVYRHDSDKFFLINKWARGIVGDIGCADKHIINHLQKGTQYIGIDYYSTATQLYKTQPNVFGDAQSLPFASESFDTLLLLDVLEHLPSPDSCIKESNRVLKPSGLLIIQIPFLYPLHDIPIDFQRFTIYGLRILSKKYGFEIIEETHLGDPLETAALLSNIAICKQLINWFKNYSPLVLFTPIIPLFVITINLFSRCISSLSGEDKFMPHGYRLILRKP